ncbi:MAG TPA: hypothetical protein V6D29_02520 [Leptolyngbyaceae cyanobacterium]
MKIIKVGLAGIAAIAALASPILADTSALSATPQMSAVQQSGALSSPVLLAELRDYCNEDESLFASVETSGYWVNICGGDLPHTYVGVSKRNGKSIRVPLADYDDDGSYFEAINGDVSYLLIRNTPRGSFLTVTQGDRELLRQVILEWE